MYDLRILPTHVKLVVVDCHRRQKGLLWLPLFAKVKVEYNISTVPGTGTLSMENGEKQEASRFEDAKGWTRRFWNEGF
jgi:hypothetical protein